MDIGGLVTSAGINISICVVLSSLYSVLRKQPSNASVYFTRRFISEPIQHDDPFGLHRFVPSAGWLMRAWQATDEELLEAGGVDAVVFMRIVVFSLRIFIIATVVCICLVLPVNYYGRDMEHKSFRVEPYDVFTIGNVEEGSKMLWAHCFAMYVISFSAFVLLYLEYKSITKMRLAHITGSHLNPSHFTILVRGVPWSQDDSYSKSVESFFSTYYPDTYVAHQMVYRPSTFHKLKKDAKKMYLMLRPTETEYVRDDKPCYLCGGSAHTFKVIHKDNNRSQTRIDDLHPTQIEKECPAAFVFFKNRYAAVIAAQVLQSWNPMLWVTQLAPEPHDVYWSNLGIPYKQVWVRKIASLLCALALVFVFCFPVAFVQGLTQEDVLKSWFPQFRRLLENEFVNRVVTGYLPSVILIVLMYTVPPIMMMLSKMEGNVSRSERKRSACIKVLNFTIWNVFFVNVLSGSFIQQMSVFSKLQELPFQLAKQMPDQAAFFTTYVLSSGWASLASELIQLFSLTWNFFRKFILRSKEEPTNIALNFPHHTEIPRMLLFGLLGFTFAIHAPLILPFLLIYFALAFLVYRNQILHVYVTKYESAGLFWPVVHNTTIFSLVLTQVIAVAVFALKEAPIASGFTIPLIVFSLLFNEYCRKRFSQVFKRSPAQVLIEMDRRDEQMGREEGFYNQLRSAYCQLAYITKDLTISEDFSRVGTNRQRKDDESCQDKDDSSPKSGIHHIELQ
ncbi:CSC1-like protein RXW8 [Hibiscus syriacus]|uniref:CSC1-like protein RXW8 n=1 Tax=Hibiscus syriacus TaxID=106335 RepID=A0A6A2XLJ8_HIBSY|nr:CSC1-like protein RXW8 [Hibiscus syriacus]KAE8676448.1 CSC1-like protein RXW8 [Hibiscus syriacus]